MQDFYEQKYHVLEENHWWFKGRRDLILKLLKRNSKDSSILEVGCSGGALLQDLKRSGFIHNYGIDISKQAIALCLSKGLENVFQADACKLPFSSNFFDIIIASDILEHVEDDCAAVQEWTRVLKKNGVLLVFVPAFKWLWTEHDAVNNHYRRYSVKQLRDVVQVNGITISKINYWNTILFIPICIIRCFQKLFFINTLSKKKDQLTKFSSGINWLLTNLLKFENYLLYKDLKLPWGVSIWVMGKK